MDEHKGAEQEWTEHQWQSAIVRAMKRMWPDRAFVSEVTISYGTERARDKSGRPDILAVGQGHGCSVIEIKRHSHSALKKWQVIGELLFYTFLLETLPVDDRCYTLFVETILKRGLPAWALEEIVTRLDGSNAVVQDWVVVIAGAEMAFHEWNETIQHMNDFVAGWLPTSGVELAESPARPLSLLHAERTEDGDVRLDNIDNAFRQD